MINYYNSQIISEGDTQRTQARVMLLKQYLPVRHNPWNSSPQTQRLLSCRIFYARWRGSKRAP